jgi:putative hemolysin
MGTIDDATLTALKLVAVLILVLANGFFVAAEFALVSVRRSRVAELVQEGRPNALFLQKVTDGLDAYLASTQLGITISSLALGWLGEPALAHVVEPMLRWIPGGWSEAASHGVAVAIAFLIITSLHIVLGELAPKSLALQRSERTALWVVRPLAVFTFVFHPAIQGLNRLGNGVLRLCGLKPGHGEGAHHSPEEFRLLFTASQEAGLIQQAQSDAVSRVLSVTDREVNDIMTPRVDLHWLDLDDGHEDILKAIAECPHEQIVACRGGIDEFVGVVQKRDLLSQLLSGQTLDVAAAVRVAPVIPEHLPVLRALEQFRSKPVRTAFVVDEYGCLEGILTQTDLLEAIAGEIPGSEGEEPLVVEREDGSLLIDGSISAHDAFARLGFPDPDAGESDYNTVAGFAISRIGRIPETGARFSFAGWDFEVVDMDNRRIDKILASRPAARPVADEPMELALAS